MATRPGADFGSAAALGADEHEPLTPAQRKQFTQLLAKLVALDTDLSRSPLQIDARPEP